MQIDILTIFPDPVRAWLECGLLKKADDSGRIQFRIHNLRDFATDKHKSVDDVPYGGGPGMVLKADVCIPALERIVKGAPSKPRILLMTPSGRPFSQSYAIELSREQHLVFLCGRYEGVDERVRDFVTDQVSIGDFVLMGGELPALAMCEAVARLIPGVVGKPESTEQESFTTGLLDYPHYTRPPEFQGKNVPEVLQSGDHGAIAEWRRKEALRLTLSHRPDLLSHVELTERDKKLLTEVVREWIT